MKSAPDPRPRPSLALIVNPHARGVRRSPLLPERLRAQVGAAGDVIITRDAAALAATAERLAAAGVDLVAICGGDGTNVATLTELVRAYGPTRLPRVALLRGGTVNTIAANLGLHGRPPELLARLLADLERDRLRTRAHDLITVDGRHGFLFAALMGARFLEAYYDAPRPGPERAALLAARTALSSLVQGPLARALFAPVATELEIDGERLPDARYRLLVAATVPDVGIGMRVAWQAGRQAGRLHLVASGISTTSMALQLPRVLTGQPLGGAPHVDRLAERVRLRFAAPQPYTLDGELFHARDLTVAVSARVDIAQL